MVLRADGGTTLDGASAGLDALLKALEATKVPGDFGPLAQNVLIVVERQVPWRRVSRVLDTCAEGRAPRLFYAARPADGSEPGAMAVFLPIDVSASQWIGQPEFFPIEIATHVEGAPSDPRGVGERIPGGVLGDRELVRLRPAPSTPAWLALRLIDEAVLAGSQNVAFARAGEEPDEPSDGAVPPALHVTLEGQPLPAGDTERLPRPRVRGGVAGVAESPRDGWNSTAAPRQPLDTR